MQDRQDDNQLISALPVEAEKPAVIEAYPGCDIDFSSASSVFERFLVGHSAEAVAIYPTWAPHGQI